MEFFVHNGQSSGAESLLQPHLSHRIKKLTYLQQHTQATLISLTCLFRDLTSHQTNGRRSVYLTHIYDVLNCIHGSNFILHIYVGSVS